MAAAHDELGPGSLFHFGLKPLKYIRLAVYR